MGSTLQELLDFLSEEEPEEASSPPDPAPVSGNSITENPTDLQASPEKSNTASKKLKLDSSPENEESQAESPAGAKELSVVEAGLVDFFLSLRRNVDALSEVDHESETSLSATKNESTSPEKHSYSEKESSSSTVTMQGNENVSVSEDAIDNLLALQGSIGTAGGMMEEAGGDTHDYGSSEKTCDSSKKGEVSDSKGKKTVTMQSNENVSLSLNLGVGTSLQSFAPIDSLLDEAGGDAHRCGPER